MKNHISLLPTLYILALPIVSGDALAANPILKYNFNDSGTTTASSGSSSYTLNMYNSSGVATDLHGASGSGVSGAASDLAFDNTASTGMGSDGVGGAARGTTAASALDGLQSLTITGWLNPSSTLANTANIFSNVDSSSGITLTGVNGRLSFSVNNVGIVSGSSAFSGTNEWVFFAITYDGTASTSNLSYYVGKVDSAAKLDITRDANGGAVQTSTVTLALGNTPSGATIRPFDGLMDDIAIYGSYSDASGVLNLAEIESIRQASLIPEDSSTSLLIGLLSLVGLAYLRLKRK